MKIQAIRGHHPPEENPETGGPQHPESPLSCMHLRRTTKHDCNQSGCVPHICHVYIIYLYMVHICRHKLVKFRMQQSKLRPMTCKAPRITFHYLSSRQIPHVQVQINTPQHRSALAPNAQPLSCLHPKY